MSQCSVKRLCNPYNSFRSWTHFTEEETKSEGMNLMQAVPDTKWGKKGPDSGPRTHPAPLSRSFHRGQQPFGKMSAVPKEKNQRVLFNSASILSSYQGLSQVQGKTQPLFCLEKKKRKKESLKRPGTVRVRDYNNYDRWSDHSLSLSIQTNTLS